MKTENGEQLLYFNASFYSVQKRLSGIVGD